MIPTRSRWRLLSRAALPAALGQERVDHEVVVVDDGSNDETSERLAEMDDPRLRVLRNDPARGVAVSRNVGVAAARGRWVSFLDDDDVWSPLKLRMQLDAAEAADAVFVYSGGGGLDANHRFLFAVAPPDPATVARQLLRWNVIWCGCSNVAARTELVRNLGGFDERLLQLADWDLWIRLALAGPAAATPEVLVGYVMHEGSMLLTESRNVFPEMDLLATKHRAASEEYGVEFDRALFNRWVARGRRLAGRRWEAAATYLQGAVRFRDVGAIPRALGSLAPERLVDLSRWLAATESRSQLRKLAVPEPEWIARYRSSEA